MISLTEKAADHAATYLRNRGHVAGLRIKVQGAGCSGMMYVVEPADLQLIEEQKFTSHGINIYVDPKSLVYLEGTEIDFVKEGLNSGLVFKNPNVKNACGCGESFNI